MKSARDMKSSAETAGFLLRLLLVGATALFATRAEAAASAKAVVYNDGRIVYYYDDVDHSSDEGFVQAITKMTTEKTPSANVTSIVIDSSFASYKPTSLKEYFANLTNATSIVGLEYLDTSSVTEMYRTFRKCASLVSLDLSTFDTSKVTTMSQMFISCKSLETLDISSFTTESLTTITYMFQGNSSLHTIYANALFRGEDVTSGSSAFYQCSTALVGGKGTVWSNSKQAGKYAQVDGGVDAPGYFTLKTQTLTIDTSDFAAKHIESVSVTLASDGSTVDPDEVGGSVWTLGMGVGFNITYTAESGYAISGETTYTDDTYAGTGLLAAAVISGEAIPTASSASLTHTLTIDTTLFSERHVASVAVVKTSDGSSVSPEQDGSYILAPGAGFTVKWTAETGCVFGHYVSVTNNGTWASSGISSDVSVEVPAASSLGSVRRIKGVVASDSPETITFYCDKNAYPGTVYARAAATGYPSWVNLSSIRRVVIDESMRDYGQDGDGFQYLFYGLSAVTNFEGLANLRTDNAKNFTKTFYGCSSVLDLDLSKMKTSKVTTFEEMFSGCSSLVTLDISSFSRGLGDPGCKFMFRGCSSLTTIYANAAFDLNGVSGNYMFNSCNSLVGGNGTTYSSSHTDPSYAHVDVPENPGYFTLKPQAGLCVILR